MFLRVKSRLIFALSSESKNKNEAYGNSTRTPSARANPSCRRRGRPTCFRYPFPLRALEDPASRRVPFPRRKPWEDLGGRKWDRLPAPRSRTLVCRSPETPIERLRFHFPFHYRSSQCTWNDPRFGCSGLLLKTPFAIIPHFKTAELLRYGGFRKSPRRATVSSEVSLTSIVERSIGDHFDCSNVVPFNADFHRRIYKCYFANFVK